MPSRKLKIQLYADECFPIPSVTYLKSLGYSIIHAFDLKQVRKSDKIHLRKSKQLGRVLITIDRDFLYYERADLETHPGVIVLSSSSSTPIRINTITEKFFKNISKEYTSHALLQVTANKIVRTKNGKRDEKRY